MFLMVKTRLGIAFVTLVASQFSKNLSYQYMESVKTIFLQLKKSRDWGIAYTANEDLFVKRYSSLNKTDDKKIQKTTFDFIFILNRRLVS